MSPISKLMGAHGRIAHAAAASPSLVSKKQTNENAQKNSSVVVLTVHVEDDPLGDGGRDVVGGDAEVGAHLAPLDLPHLEDLAAKPRD